jgi:hypothetical protein
VEQAARPQIRVEPLVLVADLFFVFSFRRAATVLAEIVRRGIVASLARYYHFLGERDCFFAEAFEFRLCGRERKDFGLSSSHDLPVFGQIFRPYSPDPVGHVV